MVQWLTLAGTFGIMTGVWVTLAFLIYQEYTN
jgi:hypothetical protein